MEKCNEAEGARLLETMQKICNATGCKEVEYATLAYKEDLRETENKLDGNTARRYGG